MLGERNTKKQPPFQYLNPLPVRVAVKTLADATPVWKITTMGWSCEVRGKGGERKGEWGRNFTIAPAKVGMITKRAFSPCAHMHAKQ